MTVKLLYVLCSGDEENTLKSIILMNLILFWLLSFWASKRILYIVTYFS